MLLNILLVAGAACANLPAIDAELESLDREGIGVAAAECWQANVLLGRAGLAAGEIDAAIARFETVAKLLPDDSMIHTWLGRALLSREREAFAGGCGAGCRTSREGHRARSGKSRRAADTRVVSSRGTVDRGR